MASGISGIATGAAEVPNLNEELPVLLDVLVSRLLLLFLLRFHGDVDVHPQFLAAEKKSPVQVTVVQNMFQAVSADLSSADSLTFCIPGKA